MTAELAIIGKGAFGSALAAVYGRAGVGVAHLGRDFPAAFEAGPVILAVPTGALADVLAKTRFSGNAVPVLCSKGMLASGGPPSSLIDAGAPFAVLSGPGFADELAAGLPTIHSLAVSEPDLGRAMAEALSTPTFRLYWSSDPVGVQVCGALKNVLAIASGIVTELGLGENARASLMVRGAREMSRGIVRLGGKAETLLTPAGFGDLFLTCASEKSRNFRFGRMIAKGVPQDEALAALGTVEGLHSLAGLLHAVDADDAPIATALAAVVAGRLSVADAVEGLMTRPLREG